MSVNIWYTSSRVWSPITVLWNLRRKCCFLWPFSSRKSCLGAVSASVSLTVPLYVYVATNEFWFIRHLRGLRSVENVSWDGSSASNGIWLLTTKGEILYFMFTSGYMDDREPLKQGKFLENIKGKLCADKGYIGQTLFGSLFLNGIQLVTKVKNNMKNSLMSIADKNLLRKRKRSMMSWRTSHR